MSQFEDDRSLYGTPLVSATLENTEITMRTHGSDRCYGEHCTIHNRSDHHMRGWPQHWRWDRGIMERTCEHGISHPDPDEYKIINGIDDGVHGCDGCCWEGEQVVEVNGVEYVEEVIGGKKVLVKKEDSLKITLELNKQDAEFIYTMLQVISGEGDFDLNHSGVVWFADRLMTFSDEGQRRAAEMTRDSEWEPLYEDGDCGFIDKYITPMEGRK